MGKFKDLTGMKFGRWTVMYRAHNVKGRIYWHCKCSCEAGTEKDVLSTILLSGKSTSCGCYRKEQLKKKTDARMHSDLIGKRFGKLTVMSYNEELDSWHCKCDCGGTREVKRYKLIYGNITTCKDCVPVNHRDITGQKFGRLTAMYYVGHSKWHCKCDCPEENEVEVYLGDLTRGKVKSCGCLGKETKKRMGEFKDTSNRIYPQWFLDEISEEDKERAKKKEITTHDYIWFNCPEHGKYLQRVGDHLKFGTGESLCTCPKCSGNIAQTGSKSENEIKDYISSICNCNITKERILDIGENKKEVDLLISDANIGIEYNGSMFHATKGSAFDDKSKLYHQQKFLAAKKQGIHLISIFDVDWNTNADKIKMYLKSLLVDNKKIFARKCEIKSVDRKIANEFTDKYHLQGHARLSSINYGLYYNDELLSVMSFGMLRLKKTEEGQYELHRYCVKDGYTIVGGANRLLKAFEREYNPKYLLSFSDNDYFMGCIYDKLGFTNDGQSTPRYYWFLNNEEIKREKCQLKHLKEKCPELLQEAYDNNASNKEDYVMLKLGACKVYRSGNTRWIKEYKS